MNGDGDLPARAGLLGRAHLALGRLAIAAAVRLRRPVTLGVRLLALNAAGEVMLVRATYVPGLVLPGGAVDPGETCREAAAREAAEEAGLVLSEPPRLFHIYLNRALGDRDHVALFVARNASQPRPPGPGAEIVAARFHRPHALPSDVTPATRARIAEVLEGRAPPDRW